VLLLPLLLTLQKLADDLEIGIIDLI